MRHRAGARKSGHDRRQRSIVGSLGKGEKVLEHTAGSSAGRHEFYDTVLFVSNIAVPSGNVSLLLRFRGGQDAVSQSGGTVDGQEGKPV